MMGIRLVAANKHMAFRRFPHEASLSVRSWDDFQRKMGGLRYEREMRRLSMMVLPVYVGIMILFQWMIFGISYWAMIHHERVPLGLGVILGFGYLFVCVFARDWIIKQRRV